MKIEQYDKIRLKDGRTASVVEIFEEGEAYLVDVDLPGPEWETIDIKYGDIESVIAQEGVHKMKRALPYILVMGGAAVTMVGVQILLGKRP